MKKIACLILLYSLFGCEEILYEEDITKNSVELLAPSNGASIVEGNLTLTWQMVNGATEYELQVTTPTFINATQIVLDTIITGASFTQLLEANTYEWRVRGLNSAYETMYTTNAFEVVAQP